MKIVTIAFTTVKHRMMGFSSQHRRYLDAIITGGSVWKLRSCPNLHFWMDTI